LSDYNLFYRIIPNFDKKNGRLLLYKYICLFYGYRLSRFTENHEEIKLWVIQSFLYTQLRYLGFEATVWLFFFLYWDLEEHAF